MLRLYGVSIWMKTEIWIFHHFDKGIKAQYYGGTPICCHTPYGIFSLLIWPWNTSSQRFCKEARSVKAAAGSLNPLNTQ